MGKAHLTSVRTAGDTVTAWVSDGAVIELKADHEGEGWRVTVNDDSPRDTAVLSKRDR